jgi:hypothetical protein
LAERDGRPTGLAGSRAGEYVRGCGRIRLGFGGGGLVSRRDFDGVFREALLVVKFRREMDVLVLGGRMWVMACPLRHAGRRKRPCHGSDMAMVSNVGQKRSTREDARM